MENDHLLHHETSPEAWLSALCKQKAEQIRRTGLYMLIHPNGQEEFVEGEISNFRQAVHILITEGKRLYAPTMFRIEGLLRSMNIPLPFFQKRKEFFGFLDEVERLLDEDKSDKQ